jgi:ATP-dependent exoDNAse (exonuclease V) alpha subunit
MQLTAGQENALRLALSSRDSLFITGSAGTGKTVVLHEIVKRLRQSGREVVTTAFTGLAALQLGGITLSRLLGLGLAKNWDELTDPYRSIDRAEMNLGDATDLIIDEISYVSGDYLGLVDQVLREVKRSKQPFGGLRLIFCGDFLQLPPVRNYTDPEFQIKWAFQYPGFKNAKVVQLTQSMRQERSVDLQLLNELREGRLTNLARLFMEAAVGRNVHHAVELHPRNRDVRTINETHLMELPGKSRSFEVWYDAPETEAILGGTLPMGDEVVLKEGAPVIVLVNQPARGYYNGTQGRVVSMASESVLIETTEGQKLTVVPHEWKVDLGAETDTWKRIRGQERRSGSAWGIPLKLGWAATIHKSQGLTLNRIRADVSKCWEPGHAYVALSRARNLTDVSLVVPFKKVLADPEALAFTKSIKE